MSFRIVNLDCVVGRRSMAIQLPSSIHAKLVILTPGDCLFDFI